MIRGHESGDPRGSAPKLRRMSLVRFGYGSCMGQFEQFRFSVPPVPLWKRVFCFRRVLTDREASGSFFGFSEKDSDGSGLRFPFLGHPVN